MRQIASLLIICVSLLSGSGAFGMQLDYDTSADSFVGMAWDGYWWAYDEDVDTDHNARARASANVSDLYLGDLEITCEAKRIAATGPGEPNSILVTSVSGSYDYGDLWDLADFLVQDANTFMEGTIVIDDFPAGSVCALMIDVEFPEHRWTGESAWQFHAVSGLDYFTCGTDPNGDDWGQLSGYLTAQAGEEIYFLLQEVGWGYAEYPSRNLGRYSFEIHVQVDPAIHPADFDGNFRIGYPDFAAFAGQWGDETCDPNDGWCGGADFDRSGQVEAFDLEILGNLWLLGANP